MLRYESDSHRRVIIKLRPHYDFDCLFMFRLCSMSTNAYISISNITFGNMAYINMCARYSSMSIVGWWFGVYIFVACVGAYSMWKVKPISYKSNGFIYLFDWLWMNSPAYVSLSPSVRTPHAWILFPLNERRLNFLECFQTRVRPYMEVELIRSNRFDLTPADRGEVLQDCNW